MSQAVDGAQGIGVLPDATRTKRILTLAAPIVFAMLTQTFINIMDTYFVGKLDPSVSIPGQAALGFSLPLLWSVGGFLSAISVGTQAITARRFGEQRNEAAGQVFTNSLLIAFVSGAVCSVLGCLAVPFAFDILTEDPAVRALGVEYGQIRLLGVLAMVATTSCKSFYDGIGRTHIHMVAAILMNVLNLVLNYCLIFGFWIFPELQVEGAAWASLISAYVGLLVMLIWTFAPSSLKVFNYYKRANLSRKVSWEIIRLSVPSGFATVFVMSGFLIFLSIISGLDQEALNQDLAATGVYLSQSAEGLRAWQDGLLQQAGASGSAFVTDWTYTMMSSRPAVYTAAAKVIIDVLSIVFISSLAFGTATATLVSQSLGDKKPELAASYGWDSAKIGFGFMSIVGALIVISPTTALDLISDDAQVIQAGADGMRLMGFTVPFIALAFVFTQGLFGAGNSKFVMIIEALLHALCLVPLTYLLAVVLDLGFIGPWIAAAVYILALAGVMGWKFWQGDWKKIEV